MSKQGCRRFLLPLFASVLLVACTQKVSLENYNRLKAGQSYEEVASIIGEPAKCDEMLGVRSCQWGNETRSITIGFLAGKAVLLSAQNLQ